MRDREYICPLMALLISVTIVGATEIELLSIGTDEAARQRNGEAQSRADSPRANGMAGQFGDKLTTSEQKIIDSAGRQVFLRGINIGSKASRDRWLPRHSPSDIDAVVATAGVNFVRFYVAWRAIEPQPARHDEDYDASYFDAIVATIAQWNARGVYVLVDMHQDTWGGSMAGHGAPEWATSHRRPMNLPQGAPWAARYLDPACYESFEGLYTNKRLDGMRAGLRDHYGAAFAYLARRLANTPGLLGYDLINEPFMGIEASILADELTRHYLPEVEAVALQSTVHATKEQGSVLSFLGNKMLSSFRQPRNYASLSRLIEQCSARTERLLTDFYRAVGSSIRQVDDQSLLFIEPFPLAGVGLQSSLAHPGLSKIVYAPHLYDAFMDSGLGYDGDDSRIERTLSQHVAKARSLTAPLVLGEWGNLYSEAAEISVPVGHHVGGLIDNARCGAAYWDHTPGDEQDERFIAACRPYPRRVAGEVLDWHYDPDNGAASFTFDIAKDISAPTVIAAPQGVYGQGFTASCSAGELTVDERRGLIFLSYDGGGRVTVEIRRRAV